MLENMSINYETKIKEMRYIMKSWQYRFITPIGRNCIVKTLLLSKLSHLSFVLPGLDRKKLKEIESEIYQFIWGGSEKVARLDAKQPQARGGWVFLIYFQALWLLDSLGFEDWWAATQPGNIFLLRPY